MSESNTDAAAQVARAEASLADEDVADLAESEMGRRILLRLVEECGIFQAAPYGGLELHEGARRIGLRWWSLACGRLPDWYSRAIQERATLRILRHADHGLPIQGSRTSGVVGQMFEDPGEGSP